MAEQMTCDEQVMGLIPVRAIGGVRESTKPKHMCATLVSSPQCFHHYEWRYYSYSPPIT